MRSETSRRAGELPEHPAGPDLEGPADGMDLELGTAPEPGAIPEPVSDLEPGTDPLVSGIQDRWERQGLLGGPWPFMALCSVVQLHQQLSKALDTELKRLDLNRTGYFLLTTLALMSSGRARLSALGKILMMHPTTVKLTVDQLEAAGLVSRSRHPHDRRATLVEITGPGRELAGAVNEALESPDGAFGVFGGMHREIFEALQPARLAAGEVEV